MVKIDWTFNMFDSTTGEIYLHSPDYPTGKMLLKKAIYLVEQRATQLEENSIELTSTGYIRPSYEINLRLNGVLHYNNTKQVWEWHDD